MVIKLFWLFRRWCPWRAAARSGWCWEKATCPPQVRSVPRSHVHVRAPVGARRLAVCQGVGAVCGRSLHARAAAVRASTLPLAPALPACHSLLRVWGRGHRW